MRQWPARSPRPAGKCRTALLRRRPICRARPAPRHLGRGLPALARASFSTGGGKRTGFRLTLARGFLSKWAYFDVVLRWRGSAIPWQKACLAPVSVGSRRLGNRGVSALLGSVGQQAPQVAPSAVQPRHHGAKRGAHEIRYLPGTEAFHVGVVDREAELLGQRLHRGPNPVVAQLLQCLLLGRAQTGRPVRDIG